MKLEQKLTAPQLAALSLAGSLLLYASVWLAPLFLPTSPIHKDPCDCSSSSDSLLGFLVFAMYFMTPLILGLLLTYMPKSALERGLIAQRWDEAILEKLRIHLEAPIWRSVTVAMGLIGIGYVLFNAFRYVDGHHLRPGASGLGYFTAMPAIALGQLIKALKPKRTPTFPPWRDYLKPIQSDHWGNRNP